MKLHLSFATILILLLCVSPEPADAKFRALLVGINYINADPDLSPLNGAVNDARSMYTLMTDTLGIPADSIRMLLERQATREAILNNFREWLIEGTEPGDVIFFQYSGHGVKVPDPPGTQKQDPVKQDDLTGQELAEAFVPFDTEADSTWKSVSNLILDSEVYLLLNELKGRDVNLFIDSCHSGGLTRDFANIKTTTRFLELPWDLQETRVKLPVDFPQSLPANVSRGLQLARQKGTSWHPEYTFFAAVKYFQLAYENPLSQGKNGMFTYSVLKLLHANPGTNYTNKQMLDYARKFIHQVAGIPEGSQEPVFYGPQGALEKPFVLLAQRVLSATEASPSSPAQQPVTDSGKTAVFVTGQANETLSLLTMAIENSDYLRLDEDFPDVIVEVQSGRVDIHHAVGERLTTIEAGTDAISRIMKALEGIYIIQQLAQLENPAVPFAVDMWIDEPGKTTFTTSDRVTLYYRVNGLPKGEKAYLTLLNVAPDGTVAILYPQKKDLAPEIGTKLYLNAEVETGKIYSIPKTQEALKPGQNVAVDLRLRLEAGQEYFKAIVTSEPIDWGRLKVGEFRAGFRGETARGLVIGAVENTRATLSWAAGSLRVEVQ